jgi:hypothetical protein
MMRPDSNSPGERELPGRDHQEDGLMAGKPYERIAPGLRKETYAGPRGTTVKYRSTVYTDGIESSQTLSFPSDREAKKWHASGTVKKDEGSLVLDTQTTFAQHCETFLVDFASLVAAGERAQKTLEKHTMISRNHLIPALGRRKLRDLTKGHVLALYA